MLMAGQAALLNAAELKQACPDGMFMTTVGDCQGKKFKLCLFQLCLLKLFNRMLRQMSHLFKQLWVRYMCRKRSLQCWKWMRLRWRLLLRARGIQHLRRWVCRLRWHSLPKAKIIPKRLLGLWCWNFKCHSSFGPPFCASVPSLLPIVHPRWIACQGLQLYDGCIYSVKLWTCWSGFRHSMLRTLLRKLNHFQLKPFILVWIILSGASSLGIHRNRFKSWSGVKEYWDGLTQCCRRIINFLPFDFSELPWYNYTRFWCNNMQMHMHFSQLTLNTRLAFCFPRLERFKLCLGMSSGWPRFNSCKASLDSINLLVRMPQGKPQANSCVPSLEGW